MRGMKGKTVVQGLSSSWQTLGRPPYELRIRGNYSTTNGENPLMSE